MGSLRRIAFERMAIKPMAGRHIAIRLSIITLCGVPLSGCALDTGDQGPTAATTEEAQAAIKKSPTGSSTIESTISIIGTDQYLVHQEASLSPSVHRVWKDLGRLDEFFRISLPDATDLQWVKGTGDEVGDEFDFILNGAQIRLEVVERDPHAHLYKYSILQSALGIEELNSTVTVKQTCHGTRLIWERKFRMAAGTSFDSMTGIVAQEFGNLVTHFE